MLFWGAIANLSQFLCYAQLPKLRDIFCKDMVEIPYYMNIKRYINQREFRSFNVNLSLANKYSV